LPTSIENIASIVATQSKLVKQASIAYLLMDSRKLTFPGSTLFFAITTANQDGHVYIKELVQKGVYNFVVHTHFDTSSYSQINFIVVSDVVEALQKIAAAHRAEFDYPVIGITGSNGKTIVKEWLAQLLTPHYNIVRSPRSYNSQIGVPLSVWGMTSQHNFAIFEAGISQKGEMEALANIIQPTIGILTNIGTAHEAGFFSAKEKLAEKCILFENAATIFVPHNLVQDIPSVHNQKVITWGNSPLATLFIQQVVVNNGQVELTGMFNKGTKKLVAPFVDKIAIENIIICWAILLHLGIDEVTIQEGVLQLRHLEMRMQIRKAQNSCYLLNDSYSNDLSSLALALDYAKQQAGNSPITLILSDFLNSPAASLVKVVELLVAYPIRKLITIGPNLSGLFVQENPLRKQGCAIYCYNSTNEYLSVIEVADFKEEFIVLKGARTFEFEKINAVLQLQVHQTRLEVNLTSLANNLKYIRQLTGPNVKLMAMVKAFGYGSGSVEVARVLQFHHADYLAVAYADEGIELRKAGIHLPIMVMNVDAAAFDALVQFHLEPEIFSVGLLTEFQQFIQSQALHNFPIHLKLNTGMNRLGFDMDQIQFVCDALKQQSDLKVQTIFSHLSASGQPNFASFTNEQLANFNQAAESIEQALGYPVVKHIANTGAIAMEKKFHLSMVRLGIGLYGIGAGKLETVVQFHTTIAQIRKVAAAETVGYNRSGKLSRDSIIATVRLGYADGYSRQLGRSKGSMWVQGKLAPVLGDICMDMTMIDITDIPGVQEGDDVEVFGSNLPIEQVANWAETIPYEILTSIGQRVKRVYIQD